MSKQYDVVALADACADLIIVSKEKPAFNQVEKLAESYEIEVGGSASIFASQVAKLGGTVALISVVGNDPLGKFIVDKMQRIGIDTRHISKSTIAKTPLGLNISVDGDRAMLTVIGSLREVSFALVTETIISQTKHWHIAGYFLLPQLHGEWLRFIKGLMSKNISISLDTNWAPDGNWKQVKELVPCLDIFLPNENEAIAITGQADYLSAGIELSKMCKLIVIKRGSKGASAFVAGKETFQAVPKEMQETLKVIDSTGAGDSFDGGFIFEWLRNATLEKCLKTAIACGTSSVQAMGGINGQLVRP
jgi:sugar/nucleoside kinase (ribokinase family)